MFRRAGLARRVAPLLVRLTILQTVLAKGLDANVSAVIFQVVYGSSALGVHAARIVDQASRIVV